MNTQKIIKLKIEEINHNSTPKIFKLKTTLQTTKNKPGSWKIVFKKDLNKSIKMNKRK